MDIRLEKVDCHDFDDYVRLVSSPEVMAMITGRALSAAEARPAFEKILTESALHPELGHFRILDGRDRSFVGLGKLAVTAAEADRAELGYILAPDRWGKGFGSRTAGLLVARAEGQPTLRSLFALVDPSNAPSRKILLNNGFVFRERQDINGLLSDVLERRW